MSDTSPDEEVTFSPLYDDKGEETITFAPMRDLDRTVKEGNEINPGTAARVIELQRKTGLDSGLIERNLDDVSAIVSDREFDPERFKADSPLTAAWLADDKNRFALAKDDTTLQDTENVLNAFNRGAQETLNLFHMVDLLAKERREGLLPYESEMLGIYREKAAAFQESGDALTFAPHQFGYVATMLADLAKEAGTGAAKTGLGMAAAGLLVGGPPGAAAFGTAGIPVGAAMSALRYMYELEGTLAWDEFRELEDEFGNKLDPELVSNAADLVGGINAFIEIGSDLTIYALWRAVGGSGAVQVAAAKAGLKSFVKEAVPKILINPSVVATTAKGAGLAIGTSAIEGLEEVWQNFTKSFVEVGMKEFSGQLFKDTDWEQVATESAEQFWAAFVGTLPIPFLAGGIPYSRQVRQIRNAQKNQAVMEALGENVSESEMHKKLPEATASHIKALKQGGVIDNVFVNVDAWDTVFQQDAAKVAEEVFGSTDQYVEARALNADLVIPLETYAEKLAATEFHVKLLEDLRLHEGDLSSRDTKQLESQLDAILEEEEAAQKKIEDPVKQVYAHIYDQLSPIMGKEEAKRNALMEAAKIRAAATQLNVDPWELYSERPLTIRRDLNREMAERDIEEPEAKTIRERLAKREEARIRRVKHFRERLAATDDPVEQLTWIFRLQKSNEDDSALREKLEAEGYEIVDLLGEKHHEGNVYDTEFIADPDRPEGEEIITLVRKPRILKDGVTVKHASVVISVGTKQAEVLGDQTKPGLLFSTIEEDRKRFEKRREEIDAEKAKKIMDLFRAIGTDDGSAGGGKWTAEKGFYTAKNALRILERWKRQTMIDEGEEINEVEIEEYLTDLDPNDIENALKDVTPENAFNYGGDQPTRQHTKILEMFESLGGEPEGGFKWRAESGLYTEENGLKILERLYRKSMTEQGERFTEGDVEGYLSYYRQNPADMDYALSQVTPENVFEMIGQPVVEDTGLDRFKEDRETLLETLPYIILEGDQQTDTPSILATLDEQIEYSDSDIDTAFYNAVKNDAGLLSALQDFANRTLEEDGMLPGHAVDPETLERFPEVETPYGRYEQQFNRVFDEFVAGYVPQPLYQSEEAERIQAEAKGLPMDKESRLKRAREMGFDTDTVWYHGTRAEFDRFEVSPNDIGIHLGTSDQAEDRLKYSALVRGGKGTTDLLGGENVVPAYVQLNNPLVIPFDPGAWDWNNMPLALERAGIPADEPIFDLMKRYENQYNQEQDEYGEPEEEYIEGMQSDFTEDMVEWLKSKGYDGIRYKNTGEIKGMAELMEQLFAAKGEDKSAIYEQKKELEKTGADWSVIVFNPNQIRSINAAFDPDFVDSPQLLAQGKRAQGVMGVNVATEGSTSYANMIVEGTKKYETRDTDSLRPYVGQRIGIVETSPGQRAQLVGYATVGEPIIADESTFAEMRDEHKVPEGSRFDIKSGGQKYLYEMTEVEKLDEPVDASQQRGIVSRKLPPLYQRASPLAPFVTGAAERLNRALIRKPGVGAPSNERVVFKVGKTVASFGKITSTDWRNRVKSVLSKEELHQAREWYGGLHKLMERFFGKVNAEKYALAWLLSQQNVSPSGGMRNVLRAADIVKGLPEIKRPGLSSEKLLEVLRGGIPKKGYDAKLLDFIDSEMGRTTRTVMGDDPKGGAPAVIDVWANRDVGKVDRRVLEWIKTNVSKDAAENIVIDGDAISETDYEYGSRFYNDLVKALNKSRFDGGKWKTEEAQAVGWVAMQKLLGVVPEYPEDIFIKNTQRASIGLAPGAASIYDGLGEIHPLAAKRVIDKAAELSNVQVVASSLGSGAYLGEAETAFQVDILGSPESILDFGAVIGLQMFQTEVIMARPLKSGKTQGVTLVQEVGTTLANPDVAEAFMAAVRQQLGDQATIADGYQMVMIDGKPALRMFKGVWNDVEERVKWGGKWRRKEHEAFTSAIKAVANEQEISIRGHVEQFTVQSEYNDWSKNPNGEAFRASLVSRGRTVLSGRLSSERELQILPHEVGPTTQTGSLDLHQEGTRGMFDPGSQTITLLRGADPSTFQHEAAHGYLENLRRWVQRADAPQQMKDDWEAISKWTGGIPSDLSQAIPTEAHEQWARGWEAYLMEGKAPSVELRESFRRLMDWLVRIYRTAFALNVELNPEIREVMDRTIATQDQIDEARVDAGIDEEILPADWMTAEEKKAYTKLRAQAHEEAETDIRTQLMDEMAREQKQFWKAESKQVEAEVTAEVEEQPVYIALAAMGTEVEKLSKDAIVAQYGKEFLKTLPRPYVYQVEGGLHPDEAAEIFGFTTGSELLAALQNAPKKSAVIKMETEARMLERHGDLMNDGTLPERAAEAVANDKQMAVYYREMQILLRQGAIGPLRSIAATKALAKALIAGKPVGEIRPKYYEAAAAKAGRDAVRAMLGKDPNFERKIGSAFEARQRQVLNLALFKEAAAQKELYTKSLRDWKVLRRADERLAKTRNMDMVNAARAILANYGIGKRDKAPADYLALMSEYDPDTYDDLMPLVTMVTSERKPIKELTLDEFLMVRDAVDGMMNMSRTANKMLVEGKRIAMEGVKAELIPVLLEEQPHAGKGKRKAVSSAEEWTTDKLHLKAALRRVESWVDMMDDGVFGGPFRKYIWQPISDAIANYRVQQRDTLQAYEEEVKKIQKTLTLDKIDAPEIDYVFGADNRTLTETITGVGSTGSGRAELIGALLHTGNESNRAKLLVGRGWADMDLDTGAIDTSRWDAFIARMQAEGVLTKEDYDFVQATWDLMETLKPGAQKAHMEMYGYYFNEVTQEPFSNQFGDYAGGYFPAITDRRFVDEAARREDKNALDKQQNGSMFPTTGRGFTKARAEGYRQPLMLDMRMVRSHIDQVLRFTHIEPRVKEAGRLMNDKEFRAAMNGLNPGILGSTLIPWLQRSASQQISTPSTDRTGRIMDSIFTGLRARTGLQIMALNVSVALQQLTGGFVAMAKVPKKHLASAMVAYTKAPNQTAEFIAGKSKWMDTHIGESIFEIRKRIDDMIINPTKYDKAKEWAAKNGYVLASVMQGTVNNVVWLGSYNRSIEEGLDETAAVKRADSDVRQTQGTFNPEDLSKLETGSPLSRAFTMFYNYFNMLGNLYATELTKIRKMTGFAGPARLFHLYFFAFLMPAVVAKAISMGVGGDLFDEDGDFEWLEVFFLSQLEVLTAMVPYVGNVGRSAMNRFNDKFYDDRISASPMFSMLEATASVPADFVKIAQGDPPSSKKVTKDVLTAVGMATGTPAAVIARPIGYIMDVEEGRTKPKNPADYVRGLVSGRGQQ